MAEFVVKIADDRGHVQEHIEQGYSEAEVRDRFSQQGYLVYWVKPQGMLTSGVSAAAAAEAEAERRFWCLTSSF
jgi:cytochrome c-type biogenesis protein CcmH/NrfF